MNKEYRKRLFDILEQIDELTEPAQLSAGDERQEAGEEEKREMWPAGHCVEPNHDHKKRYSPEFKKMVVKLKMEEGWTTPQIIARYGVSKATITKWCSDARYEDRTKLQEKSKKLEKIQQKYEQIKAENVFLKRIVIMMLGNEMEVRQ